MVLLVGGMVAKSVSQRKLDQIRREWQKKLKLQDWKITSKFVKKHEWPEDKQDSIAYNEIELEPKTGNIKLLMLEELEGNQLERAQDIENTVVHELLHCHLHPFWTSEYPLTMLQEQMIEVVTEALLNEKRRNARTN